MIRKRKRSLQNQKAVISKLLVVVRCSFQGTWGIKDQDVQRSFFAIPVYAGSVVWWE
jgi:hypothetical protein